MPNRRPQLQFSIAPGAASDEEAAAVIAALEQFLRDTTPPLVAPPARQNPWQRAALFDAVSRESASLDPWGDGHPWGR